MNWNSIGRPADVVNSMSGIVGKQKAELKQLEKEQAAKDKALAEEKERLRDNYHDKWEEKMMTEELVKKGRYEFMLTFLAVSFYLRVGFYS